jgi:hypothetical protein
MSTESSDNAYTWEQLTKALKYFIYLMTSIGVVIILIYGVRFGNTGTFNIISVALMTAGAALLSGGLLGLLFGVPHSQAPDEHKTNRSKEEEEDADQQSDRSLSTGYRPNTSLEQISDWLTKMLVGVGLVEIKVIPEKLIALATFVSKGMSTGDNAEPFCLSLLIYFTACGFVFGFLWARLYLVRLFREGDTVKVLTAKVSQLEKQLRADTIALGLLDQLTNPAADSSGLNEGSIAVAIKAASPIIKSTLFNQAVKISGDKKADNYQDKLRGMVLIFKGLITSDSGDRYHRNHYELANTLRRQTPPDLAQAMTLVNKAIEIRNRLRVTGWKYEYLRARCRIEQDPDFENRSASAPDVVGEILIDLGVAARGDPNWARHVEPHVRKWMDLNRITDADLVQR